MQYRYLAYNLTQGVVSGRIEARSEVGARTELIRQGYKSLLVKPSRGIPTVEELFPSLFRVKTSELAGFVRHLAAMLASGGSLVRTLEMLQKETRNHAMRRILRDISKTIDEGGSLSDALRQHPTLFTPLFVSVVEVGEYTGRPGPALEQLADILEKDHEAKQKAIRTLIYPVAIVGLSVITMGILMVVALPPMLKVFNSMGAEVPLITRLTMALFSQAKERALEVALGMLALGIMIKIASNFPRIKLAIHGALVRAPVFGAVIVAGELARFTRGLSMLLEAGVPLATAMHLGVSGCKNLVLRKALSDAEESLLSGHGLTSALKNHPVLPSLFLELVMVGEESNSLRRTMKDAADAYQKQLERRLNNLLAMLEPASTLVVGAVVGLMAFSMFMPIYSGLDILK